MWGVTPVSVQTSKAAFAFNLPEMLSYHSTWDDADYEPKQPNRHRHTLFERLSEISRALALLPRRMMVRNELYSMSDRELADIGLNRYEIDRVFDPEFANEYAHRGM